MEEKTTYIDGSLTLREGYFTSEGMWKDELQSLIAQQKNNPSDDIVANYAEGTLDFKTTADLTSYAVMNIQLNHDWEIGTVLKPHLHWFQAQDNVPNWLVQYRWQGNGGAKVTTWTSVALGSGAFTYVSGTLLQISGGLSVAAPADAALSDVVQFRLLRDSANASGLFAGADPYTATAGALNFDVHYQVDTNGSRQEYIK